MQHHSYVKLEDNHLVDTLAFGHGILIARKTGFPKIDGRGRDDDELTKIWCKTEFVDNRAKELQKWSKGRKEVDDSTYGLMHNHSLI